MGRYLFLVAMAVSLTGCVKPVAYDRPAPPVPNAWPDSATSPGGSGASDAVAIKWQDYFNEPGLRSTIELALANNRDLRSAALSVERVQALYRIQRAEQFPAVSVSATGDIYRLPETAQIAGFNLTQAANVAQYTISLGVTSWELDLFGRIRSLKSAALENFLASEQARTATQISLVSAVAQSYLALAADKDNLQLSRDTFDAQQASYDLILKTRNAGMASDLDLRQAESQVETARVDIARYTAQVALDENALDLLAGTPVPKTLLPAKLESVGSLKDIRAGVPSEVLLLRPDIRLAEHELKSANANIGAARAAYFPRISLTGGAGLLSRDLTDLLSGSAGTWSFAPQIGLPIFDAGARKANVKVAEVSRDLAVSSYEKAIQSAFREVSDSLTLRTRLKEQQDAQEALVYSLAEAYRLSDARYKAGIDSYLSVLVAQRALYRAQQVLVNLRAARVSNLVTLYKVLGGGA